jgi:hypothetical protein
MELVSFRAGGDKRRRKICTYARHEGIWALVVFDVALYTGERLIPFPDRFKRKEPSVPIKRMESGWAPEPVWTLEKRSVFFFL